MKNLLLTILIFLFALSANGQQCETVEDCNQKLAEAAQMINKLLDIKKADDKAFIDSQAEKTALKIVIAEMERAKQTPCTVAAEKVKSDLTFWLGQLDTPNKVKEKEILKVLKGVRKTGKKMIAKQCGDDSKSVWAQVWDVTKVLIPVGAVLIAK